MLELIIEIICFSDHCKQRSIYCKD